MTDANAEGVSTKTEIAATWNDVAKASAEAQAAPDPVERPFTELLPVALTAEERLAIQDKRNAVEVELERLEADWKTRKEVHKAAVAEKKNAIAGYAQQLRDKVITKPVKCIEYTSFSVNARWRVRTDTGAELSREAIPAGERQQLLYPEDKEDGQLAPDDDVDSADFDGDNATIDDDEDDVPQALDSTTNITDPDTILSGSMPGDEVVKPKRARKK